MSFLTEKMLRPMATSLPRVAIANAPRAAAPFHISAAYRKTPVESVKDAAKKVDRTVTDNVAIPAVDAAAKVRDSVANSDPQGKAQELKHEAAAKAQELKGEAAGKKEELKGEASGAAARAKGKAQGIAEEAKAKI